MPLLASRCETNVRWRFIESWNRRKSEPTYFAHKSGCFPIV